ncbi:MAG: hypothetical protein JSS66_11790 [Armatimonadetes bacterium]|nr:hypothetical protein [Armatimonadota bacterium]
MVDVQGCLDALVFTLSEQDTIDPAAVKGYLRVSPVWATGEGAPDGFIHLTVCVLAGRPPELLSAVSDRLYSQALDLFRPALDQGVAKVTLELREMIPEVYRK